MAALLLLISLAALAHDGGAPPDDGQVGVRERLGTKIPSDLRFTDEQGRTIRLADLVTGPTLILPVYYGCTNVCNLLQQGVATALPRISGTPGRDFRIISVSFDDTETPPVAARYRQMYLQMLPRPIPADGWRFLTGDRNDIQRLTAAAGYGFRRQGRDFLHPVVSFVVSGDGTIVRYLYGTTFLPKDLSLALLEAKSGRTGATIRTVVGYCFSFDPAGKTYVFNLLRVSAGTVMLTAMTFLAYLIHTSKKRSAAHRQRRGEGT